MRIVAALIVISCLVAAPAMAQQSAADCADLEDDRDRLECYDRFFSQRGDSSEYRSEMRETAPVSSRRTTETARRGAEPQRPPASPEDSFGRDRSMLDMGGEEMSSTALGDFRYWQEGQRIELDNGQVWEITNDTNLFFKASNPRVTIEKGFFSSFYMHIDGVSKSLRVRRVR